jgi:hypothetical protein
MTAKSKLNRSETPCLASSQVDEKFRAVGGSLANRVSKKGRHPCIWLVGFHSRKPVTFVCANAGPCVAVAPSVFD